MAQMRRFWVILAQAAFLIAVFGVVSFSRSFSHLKFSGLHILEILYLFLAPVLLSQVPSLKKRRDLWPVFAFGAWGFFRLGGDLVQLGVSGAASTASWNRIAQHALLFVYPVLWVPVGIWVYSRKRVWNFAVWGIIATIAVADTIGLVKGNGSVGPVLALAATLLLREAISRTRILGSVAWTWLAALVVSVIGFAPFWEMWLTYMQRTSLMMLVFTAAVAPLLLEAKSRNWARAFKTIAVSTAIFWAGLFSYVAYVSGFQNIFQNFLSSSRSSLIHPEDAPTLPEDMHRWAVPPRFRTHNWLTAISDWSAHPLVGIGFVPEVPSSVLPGLPNTGGFEYQDAPPVAGPHNSYLSILARMGVIGLALFVWIAVTWLRRLPFPSVKNRTESILDLMLWFIPLNGAIYALFNVGLEGPHHALLGWIFVGAGLVAGSPAVRKPRA